MIGLLASLAALTWVVRLSRVRGLWRLPLRNGEGFFLAQRVGPGFYREAGARLLRSYRASLFLPLALDAPLVLWLAATGRYALLVCEQWIALIATVVLYNVMLAHFSARATVMVRPDEPGTATTVHLSMAPRRLRDHSSLWVELALSACLLFSLALLARVQSLAVAAPDDWHAVQAVRKGVLVTVWIAYLQLGLLLLKSVFVRWRMPLPVRRTEDFRRWRAAWLSHHLRLFDTLRLVFGLLLLSTMTWLGFEAARSRIGAIGGLGGWALVILAFALFQVSQSRRLAAVEREIKPVELVDEFPRRPIPEGRFLAGGLLYFSRDNPHVLVRSRQGIAEPRAPEHVRVDGLLRRPRLADGMDGPVRPDGEASRAQK